MALPITVHAQFVKETVSAKKFLSGLGGESTEFGLLTGFETAGVRCPNYSTICDASNLRRHNNTPVNSCAGPGKPVQMAVLPTHSGLHDVMKLGQREVRGYQDPSPNHGPGAEQGDFDLIDGFLGEDISCVCLQRGHPHRFIESEPDYFTPSKAGLGPGVCGHRRARKLAMLVPRGAGGPRWGSG